jgi:hypothetical protein
VLTIEDLRVIVAIVEDVSLRDRIKAYAGNAKDMLADLIAFRSEFPLWTEEEEETSK